MLDESGDIAIVNGDIVLISDEKLVEQRIRIALRTFLGEWFANNAVGIPYFESILGLGNSISKIKAILINEINSLPEIQEIIDFDVMQDGNVLLINITVIDINGNTISIENDELNII